MLMILKFWVKKQFFRYQKKKKKEIDGFFFLPLHVYHATHRVKKNRYFQRTKNSAHERNDNFGCLTSFFPGISH